MAAMAMWRGKLEGCACKRPRSKESKLALEAERGKEADSCLAALERVQTCQHLDFSSVRLILDCLDSKIIYFCCFKPLYCGDLS